VAHHDANIGPLTRHGDAEVFDISFVEIDTHSTTNTVGAKAQTISAHSQPDAYSRHPSCPAPLGDNQTV